jgi:hypothetical protein
VWLCVCLYACVAVLVEGGTRHAGGVRVCMPRGRQDLTVRHVFFILFYVSSAFVQSSIERKRERATPRSERPPSRQHYNMCSVVLLGHSATVLDGLRMRSLTSHTFPVSRQLHTRSLPQLNLCLYMNAVLDMNHQRCILFMFSLFPPGCRLGSSRDAGECVWR